MTLLKLRVPRLQPVRQRADGSRCFTRQAPLASEPPLPSEQGRAPPLMDLLQTKPARRKRNEQTDGRCRRLELQRWLDAHVSNGDPPRREC